MSEWYPEEPIYSIDASPSFTYMVIRDGALFPIDVIDAATDTDAAGNVRAMYGSGFSAVRVEYMNDYVFVACARQAFANREEADTMQAMRKG